MLSEVRVVVLEEQRILAQAIVQLVNHLDGLHPVGYAVTVATGRDLLAGSRWDATIYGALPGDDVTAGDTLRLLDAAVVKGPVIFLRDRPLTSAHDYRVTFGGDSASDLRIALMEGVNAYQSESRTGSGRNDWPQLRKPSTRELEVLRLVGDGRSDGEIAGVLGISARTVETHVGRLFARHSVRSRAQLLLVAERRGWLDTSLDPATVEMIAGATT